MNAQVDVMLSVLSIGACYAGRTYEYHSPLSPAGIIARGRDSPSLDGIATRGRLR